MHRRHVSARWLLISLLGAACLCGRPAAAQEASGAATTATDGNAVIHLNRLMGVFTVTGVQSVNGVTEAVGLFTAEATDSTGVSLDVLTGVPMRLPMPLNAALTGKGSLSAKFHEPPVIPPQLSTNLCTILGISIEFIDLVIPGLGLNLHVNEIVLVVRADRETTLGDVLCTLLGEDAFGNNPVAAASLNVRSDGKNVLIEGTGPGTLRSAPTVNGPVPWVDVLKVEPNQFFKYAPTGTPNFFKLEAR